MRSTSLLSILCVCFTMNATLAMGSEQDIAAIGSKQKIATMGSGHKENTTQMPMQGEPLSRCMKGSFNAPAVFEDSFYGSLSFLYWYGGEEGLLYATNGILSGGTLYHATNNKDLTQSFEYKPGFKLGLGYIMDNEWVFGAEYTWLRGTNSISKPAPSSPTTTSGTAAALSGTPVWVVQDWFIQPTSGGQALSGTRVAAKWKYALDLIDAFVSRPYYQGTHLTIVPFGGLRCALIRQKVRVALTEVSGQSGITLPAQPILSRNRSSSWAVGPRVGFDTNYLLCRGFRFEGSAAGSILYTRYTKLRHKEDSASTTFNAGPYTYHFKSYNCLRPMAELGLGLGWGTYFRCQKYHLDFSASYDFNFFWSQNMLSKLVAEFVSGGSSHAEDLYFHGLTLTGRFDF